MKRTILFVMIISFGLFLVACGNFNETEAHAVATMAALGTPPPPKYQTAAAIYLGLTLTPTQTLVPTQTPYPGTPTKSIQEYLATGEAQRESNNMTQQANEMALEREKLYATQKAVALEATNVAVKKTAQAFNAQQTAWAISTNQQATAYSYATATGQHLVFIQQTEAAHQLETATAAQQTAIVKPTSDIWTSIAITQEIAIKQGEVEQVNLAVKRQVARNMLDAFLPWALIIAAAYVLGRGFQTYVKTRTHPRDDHGRPQAITRELSDGGVVYVKPEQLETGILKVTGQGEVIRYGPIDKQEQSDITRRSQAVDAIAALPSPYAQQATKIMNAEFGNKNNKPPVMVREDQALRPALDEADQQFLQED